MDSYYSYTLHGRFTIAINLETYSNGQGRFDVMEKALKAGVELSVMSIFCDFINPGFYK